jgi:hypothetical protein
MINTRNLIDPDLANALSVRKRVEEKAEPYKAADQTPEDGNPNPGEVYIVREDNDKSEQVNLSFLQDQAKTLKQLAMAIKNKDDKTTEIATMSPDPSGITTYALMNISGTHIKAESAIFNPHEPPGYKYTKKDFSF